jgi:arylsulfatase A-like enzyme
MNVVFLLCDQLRADFLSAYGCQAIRTPHLDRLAREGVVYENAVSPNPLCVPARASMLTGQNPLESGVLSNHHWLRPDREAQGIRTWPSLAGEKGWHTASIGKMHFHPWEASEGFAERIIAEDKRWPLIEDDYADFLNREGLRKFDAIGHPDYRDRKGAVTFPYPEDKVGDRFVGESAAAYLRRQSPDRPFALMVGFPGPHCPYDPCEESLGRVDENRLPPLRHRPENSPEAWDRMYERFLAGHRSAWHQIDYATFTEGERLRIRRHYAALICQIDDEVGRVLDALDARNLMDDTVVFFSSDHGDFVGDLGMVGKELFYEPSVHIPLIVRLPRGRRAGERVPTPVELSQVPATILELAEARPGNWSYPPLAVVAHNADREPDRPIFGVLEVGAWIRNGKWKLTRYQIGFGELFDLEEDPWERRNLWEDPDCAEVRKDLEDRLNRWILESAVRGHGDKMLSVGEPLYRSRAFAARGWTRTYPQELKS